VSASKAHAGAAGKLRRMFFNTFFIRLTDRTWPPDAACSIAVWNSKTDYTLREC